MYFTLEKYHIIANIRYGRSENFKWHVNHNVKVSMQAMLK